VRKLKSKKYISLDYGVGALAASLVPLKIGEALHPDDEIMQMVAAGNHLREFRAALKRGEIVVRRDLDNIPIVPETAVQLENSFCYVEDFERYVAKFGLEVRFGQPPEDYDTDAYDNRIAYEEFKGFVEDAIEILRMNQAMPRNIAWAWMALVSKGYVNAVDEAREREIEEAHGWILNRIRHGLPTCTEDGIPTDTTKPFIPPDSEWDVEARMFVRLADVRAAALAAGRDWPDLDNLIVNGRPWSLHADPVTSPAAPDVDASKQNAGEPESATPTLTIGANPRPQVERYVAHLARTLFQHGDSTRALAEKIRLDMKNKGYRSERGAPSTGTIVRMLPVGLTGGRAKNGRK
jgi:hypothetical protein